jgi:hypothetical protein
LLNLSPRDQTFAFSESAESANQAFHASYLQLIRKTRLGFGTRQLPVIIKHQDSLVLYYDGVLHEAADSHELYHILKAVSHLPFGLYLALVANGYGALSHNTLEKLVGYRRLTQTLSNALIFKAPCQDCRQTCNELLALTLEFIDSLCLSQQLIEPALDEFSRSCKPLFQENISKAARLELENLHAQVSQWKVMIGETAWQNLFVVICVGHQARHREMALQYFRRLLNEPDSLNTENEDRVICAEAIGDMSAALDLLARHIIDQQASRAFFANTNQLQQDLHAEASAEFLDQLFLI